MCSKSFKLVLFMTGILNLTWLHKSRSTPITSASLIREALVQVPWGETATLLCESNDENHSFIYWYLNERDLVIGPGNVYDNGKFRYEVLSGNLTVKAVSKEEEGVYNCVSRGVKSDDVNIRSVRMVVQADWEEVYEEDPNVNIW
ncbi:hypothetical protein Zmor_027736 [Zophobas morio]|uniref:Ig-like domain-containing protein n=1 Tax=Zophobas morio TaxID=2755281 RepID=A0AA38HPK6_9CUCU|nr:hypothetical protein Zmor_027736 [Zophobas morio]